MRLLAEEVGVVGWLREIPPLRVTRSSIDAMYQQDLGGCLRGCIRTLELHEIHIQRARTTKPSYGLQTYGVCSSNHARRNVCAIHLQRSSVDRPARYFATVHEYGSHRPATTAILACPGPNTHNRAFTREILSVLYCRCYIL